MSPTGRQRAAICTKMKNARAKRAKLLLFIAKYANLRCSCRCSRRCYLSFPLMLLTEEMTFTWEHWIWPARWVTELNGTPSKWSSFLLRETQFNKYLQASKILFNIVTYIVGNSFKDESESWEYSCQKLVATQKKILILLLNISARDHNEFYQINERKTHVLAHAPFNHTYLVVYISTTVRIRPQTKDKKLWLSSSTRKWNLKKKTARNKGMDNELNRGGSTGHASLLYN